MRCCRPAKRPEPVAFRDEPEYEAEPKTEMPKGEHKQPIATESRVALTKTLSEIAINQETVDNLSRNH